MAAGNPYLLPKRRQELRKLGILFQALALPAIVLARCPKVLASMMFAWRLERQRVVQAIALLVIFVLGWFLSSYPFMAGYIRALRGPGGPRRPLVADWTGNHHVPLAQVGRPGPGAGLACRRSLGGGAARIIGVRQSARLRWPFLPSSSGLRWLTSCSWFWDDGCLRGSRLLFSSWWPRCS